MINLQTGASADIMAFCKEAGHPDRVLEFGRPRK